MVLIKCCAEVDNDVVYVDRTVIGDTRGDLEGLINKRTRLTLSCMHCIVNEVMFVDQPGFIHTLIPQSHLENISLLLSHFLG